MFKVGDKIRFKPVNTSNVDSLLYKYVYTVAKVCGSYLDIEDTNGQVHMGLLDNQFSLVTQDQPKFKVGDKVSIKNLPYDFNLLEDLYLINKKYLVLLPKEIYSYTGYILIEPEELSIVKLTNYEEYKDLEVNTLVEVINHSDQTELLYFSHVQELRDIIICFSNGRTSYTAVKDSSGTTSVNQILSIIPTT